MNTTPTVELTALRDLHDYRVISDDVDPRGWGVQDSNGVNVGSVSDLIIDVEGLLARYIVCDVTRGESREVLLPTGFARLEHGSKMVHLDFVTAADLESLPTYQGLLLSAAYTAQMEKALTGVAPTPTQPKIVRRTDETRSS